MAPRRMETKPMIFCVKSLLLLHCFVFWLTGVVLLGVGLWWRFMLSPYLLLLSAAPSCGPLVLCAAGAAILLFGLFGCCAACRGRPWMLKLYAVLLFVAFMAEIIAGISGFIFRHEIKGTFLLSYSEAVLKYNGRDDRSVAVDRIQHTLQCCGVFNYSSWLSSSFFSAGGIPQSCCRSPTACTAQQLRTNTAQQLVHTQGCYQLVVSFLEENLGVIAGVTFGIAFSQLIGMSLACCLSRLINANQYEMV